VNFAELAINNKTTTLVLTVLMVVGGLNAYQGLGRLEDPAFTIKTALVITPYPGATAQEVEEEVTDHLEQAVQKLGQLDELESRSEPGLSTLNVDIKKSYDAAALPQVWDELRRKVGDAQRGLPPGAGPSLVVDDFGDVYGIFLAIHGEDYSYTELREYAEFLQRELLLVQDVAKIDLFGMRNESIYVELDRDRMAQLGIPLAAIVNELQQRNAVVDAGRVEVGPDFVAIRPTGVLQTVEDFGSILLSGAGSDRQIFLRDVGTVTRGYVDPPQDRLRFDGQAAIGLGISTVADGNVVVMGAAFDQRLRELETQRPLGVEIGVIAQQADAVVESISGFVINLVEAILIVIVVLLLFMGLRSGLLIGFILALTIAGSFILMSNQGVQLQRISLGALIIALGMLVDNAIVVVDGMLVKMQQGVDRVKAAIDVVAQTAWPLLGATIVAILAFAAIGTSQDSTGEYCRSLFQVIWISLGLSWITGVTVTPLLGVMFLKVKVAAVGEALKDPYDTMFYRAYKGLLRGCIRLRWVSVVAVVAAFAGAVYGFGFVEQSFFPDSTRPQFMVDFRLARGTHIDDTTDQAAEVETYLRELDNVTHVTAVVGRGAMRFLLTYSPEKADSSYTQFLVDVDDFTAIERLIPEIQTHLDGEYPQATTVAFRFALGPGEPGKIRARLMGPETEVLRGLANRVEAIFRADPGTVGIRSDWRNQVKTVTPTIAEEQAGLNGITRRDVALSLRQGFEGAPVGVYRERDDLLPIILRAADAERGDVASMRNLQIWSPAAATMIPIRQVVSGFETTFTDDVIVRQDRRRTITVFADSRSENSSTVFARLRPQVEAALDLPLGYSLEWWGEYRDSGNAQTSLAGSIPLFIVMMILIVVALFNSIRLPLIIWLTVPLALIGVTVGLLSTGQPFGFMSLLGFLSLMGMLIKNAIVLIDEINLQIGEGKHPYHAILDSGAGRLRPVALAAITTIMGMLPLFADAFFVAMAVTISFGLGFATILTMVVVPLLYAIFFKVHPPSPADAPASA
jgi:multidrug efflux pump subunit AcrB